MATATATKGIIYGLLAAFCYGMMPVLTKLLYHSTGVDPFFFLMIRYSFAAIFIWTFLLARKEFSWRGITPQLGGWMFATACCYTIVTAAYFIALKYINASLNTLLVFTYPIFTPFLGVLFHREKLNPLTIGAALIGFLGCAFVIGGYHLQGTSGETWGIVLALISGVIYAFYTTFGQKMTVHWESIQVITLNITFAALFFIVMRLPWIWTHPQPFQVYWVAAIVALVATILANYFYFEAIRAVGAVKAGIFSGFEPVFTTVLAIVFLGETMGLLQIAGAVLILGGMFIVQQPWKNQPIDVTSLPTATAVFHPRASLDPLHRVEEHTDLDK